MENTKLIKITYVDGNTEDINIPTGYEVDYVKESYMERIAVYRDYLESIDGIGTFVKNLSQKVRNENIKSTELFISDISIGTIISNTYTKYNYKISTSARTMNNVREIFMVINE